MRLDAAIKLSLRRWEEADMAYWKVRRKSWGHDHPHVLGCLSEYSTPNRSLGDEWLPYCLDLVADDWIAIVPKRKHKSAWRNGYTAIVTTTLALILVTDDSLDIDDCVGVTNIERDGTVSYVRRRLDDLCSRISRTTFDELSAVYTGKTR